jgi:hypothetical protein
MANAKTNESTKLKKPKKRNPGVHSKKRSSNSKNAKYYKKKNVGQG